MQLRDLTVIKRNGRRVPFDRDKLVRSLQVALRKRPVDPERVETMVSAVVRELESGGEAEISSEAIGEILMEHLRQLDRGHRDHGRAVEWLHGVLPHGGDDRRV